MPISDVAKKSGVSMTTVSLVLNNAPRAKYIAESTKEVVRQVAKELNYQPNIYARTLRGNRTETIGAIVFDITDPYCAHILRGIENETRATSFQYLLSDAQNESDRFRRNLDILMLRRVEGLVLVANSLSMDLAVLESIHNPQIPIVVIGRQLPESTIASTVSINNEYGGYMALQHLYELGHRRIVYLRGPKTIVDSVLRWEGIEEFAKKMDLKIPRQTIVDLPTPPINPSVGFYATKALLKRGVKFTALLAFDDMTALGAVRALTEEGIEVPRECSVIGFDDIDAASYYNPPLTTVRQPMVHMGEEGARILLTGIQAVRDRMPILGTQRFIEPELVVRNSTAALGSAAKKEKKNDRGIYLTPQIQQAVV